MGEDFAVLLCLFAGEFVVLAADGEVVLVFGLGGLQIGLYARDGGVKILLREFAFPYGDDGSGEGVEALGVEFVAGDVAGHFLAPELLVGLGNGVLGATPVAVPEAAVDEDVGAIWCILSDFRRSKSSLTTQKCQPFPEKVNAMVHLIGFQTLKICILSEFGYFSIFVSTI